MRLVFPYMGRWHSANRSRYHQLLEELGRQGHEIHVFQPPPLALGDISFTEMDRAMTPNVYLHRIAVPARLWRRRLPAEKLVKKGVLALLTGQQLRGFEGKNGDSILLLYNLPQYPLLGLSGYQVHLDLPDDLPALLAHEAGVLNRMGVPRLARHIQKRMVRAARTVTVAAQAVAPQTGGKGIVLPNGANLKDLAQADGRAERARYTGPLVAFLGAIEYWVDTALLYEVARRLPTLQFVLAGGGRLWQRTQAALRDVRNVHLTGPVSNPCGLNLLAAADICWIPFTHEPVCDAFSPLKLFEYAGLGKPVISTRIGEVQHLGHGWVRFADSAEETVEAIQELLAHPEQARSLGEAGRQQVEHTYNWTRLSERFCQIVTEKRP